MTKGNPSRAGYAKSSVAAYSYIPNAQRHHYPPASLPGPRLPADRSATRSRRHLFLQPNPPQVWLEVRTCCPIIVTMYNARHCGALPYYWVVRIPKAGGRSLPSGGSLIRWRIRSSIHPFILPSPVLASPANPSLSTSSYILPKQWLGSLLLLHLHDHF